jgi:hypothetical protein
MTPTSWRFAFFKGARGRASTATSRGSLETTSQLHKPKAHPARLAHAPRRNPTLPTASAPMPTTGEKCGLGADHSTRFGRTRRGMRTQEVLHDDVR